MNKEVNGGELSPFKHRNILLKPTYLCFGGEKGGAEV
jgi:hypothetical protein